MSADVGSVWLAAVRSGRRWIEAIELFRHQNTRRGSLLWTRNVNHRGGSVIAHALLTTAVRPDAVTLAGFVGHACGAALVVAAAPTASWPLAVTVLVVWQMAFSLDCADGQLARARRQQRPRGAWLDQVFDFMSHVAVLASLVVYVADARSLSGLHAAELFAVAAGGNLLLLFASAERNALVGPAPARESIGPLMRRVMLGRNLADWGLFTFACALLLLVPTVLSVVLLAFGALCLLAVLAQVAINWGRP